MQCPGRPKTAGFILSLFLWGVILWSPYPALATEEDLYNETYFNMVELEGIYEDPALSDYIYGIGKRLEAAAYYDGPTVEYLILDSPIVNAAALPPNHVFLNRGLLAYMNSEAELAFVMGHELGHLQGRHVPKKLSKIREANVFQWLGSNILLPLLNLGGLGTTLADLSLQLTVAASLNEFSRSEEAEADQLGFRSLSRAGYSPQGAVRSLKQMDLLSSGRPDLFYYLMASHPLTGDRITSAENYAKNPVLPPSNKQKTDEGLGRKSYLNIINGMEVGKSPRWGTLEENRYENEYYDFTFDVPGGWDATSTSGAPLLLSKRGEIFKLDIIEQTTPLVAAEQRAAWLAKSQKATLVNTSTETVFDQEVPLQQYARHVSGGFYWPWEVPMEGPSWDGYFLFLPKGDHTVELGYIQAAEALGNGQEEILSLASRLNLHPPMATQPAEAVVAQHDTKEATAHHDQSSTSVQATESTSRVKQALPLLEIIPVPLGKTFRELSLEYYETDKYAKDLAEINGKREDDVTDYPLIKLPPAPFFEETYERRTRKVPRAKQGGFSLYTQFNGNRSIDRVDANGVVNHPLGAPGWGAGLSLTFPGSTAMTSLGVGYYFQRARTDVGDAAFTAIPVRFDVDIYPFDSGPFGEFLYFKIGTSYTLLNRTGSGWNDGLTPDPGFGQSFGMGVSRGNLFGEVGYTLDRTYLRDGSGTVVNFLDQQGLYVRLGTWL